MRPVLVTCGATRNPIDAVRYLSAWSTGRTGLWLAHRLEGVHVLASAEAALRAPRDLSVEEFGSTADLESRMEHWVRGHPDCVVVHAAAVGDYAMPSPGAGKIASGQEELVLRLVPTGKILDRIRAWSAGADVVSFKAAAPGTTMEALAAIAVAQRERSGSAYVFANAVDSLERDVLIAGPGGVERFQDRERGLEALLAGIVTLRAGSPAT
jgi:phosphopantothenoylcysteine decarboxylase/phosphopantothenate--cysteine ligase